MKKFTLLCSVAISFLGSAQIPTNGLLDYWRLNGNLDNVVSQGQPLAYPQVFVCDGPDFGPPTMASIYGTQFYKQGPSDYSQQGYYTHLAAINQTYTCYSFAFPGGYPQPFSGNYQNYLYTPADYNFGSNSRSVAMWVKRYSGSNAQHQDYVFFTGQTSNNEGFTMQLNGNKVYVATYGSSFTQGTIPVDTLWHHYVAIYHNNACQIYFDGQLLASANSGTNVNTAAGPMYFGIESGNFVYDNVMVYDRQLSASEVQTIYNIQLNGESSASLIEQDARDINIYPNPASTQFTLSNLAAGGRLTIMDVSGKTVFSEIVNADFYVVNSGNYVAGMYYVQFEHNGQVSQKKLIISK